jgi:hypothetical protein
VIPSLEGKLPLAAATNERERPAARGMGRPPPVSRGAHGWESRLWATRPTLAAVIFMFQLLLDRHFLSGADLAHLLHLKCIM